jgi:hypothetical protein
MPVHPDDFCFVRYTFPPELGLEDLDPTNIVASGMFVDDVGQATTDMTSFDKEKRTAVIFGCNFNA